MSDLLKLEIFTKSIRFVENFSIFFGGRYLVYSIVIVFRFSLAVDNISVLFLLLANLL